MVWNQSTPAPPSVLLAITTHCQNHRNGMYTVALSWNIYKESPVNCCCSTDSVT